MENKIKWDGSQEAFDAIQEHFAKLGDGFVESKENGTLVYTIDGKETKLAKGRYFKYEVADIEVAKEPDVNPLLNSKGEFKSRRTKPSKRAAGK